MNSEVKAKWIAALHSGKYVQGRTYLRGTDNTFCCLGVLCQVAIEEGVALRVTAHEYAYQYGDEEAIGSLPKEVRTWADCTANPIVVFPRDDSRNTLSSINDMTNLGFHAIADMIDESL